MSYKAKLNKNGSDFTNDGEKGLLMFRPKDCNNTAQTAKAWVNYVEDSIVPGTSSRSNDLRLTTPMTMRNPEQLSSGQAAQPSVQTPTNFSTNTGQIFALGSECGTQICKGNLSYQNFTSPFLDAPQSSHSFIQSSAMYGGVTQCYAPGNTVVVKAANQDGSAYQTGSPLTGMQQVELMSSSPGALDCYQQTDEEESIKRVLRLMKNRKAARESRRKKKEYLKWLENYYAILENQNRALSEQLKGFQDN